MHPQASVYPDRPGPDLPLSSIWRSPGWQNRPGRNFAVGQLFRIIAPAAPTNPLEGLAALNNNKGFFITVRCSKTEHGMIQAAAARDERSVSSCVLRIVREYLKLGQPQLASSRPSELRRATRAADPPNAAG